MVLSENLISKTTVPGSIYERGSTVAWESGLGWKQQHFQNACGWDLRSSWISLIMNGVKFLEPLGPRLLGLLECPGWHARSCSSHHASPRGFRPHQIRVNFSLWAKVSQRSSRIKDTNTKPLPCRLWCIMVREQFHFFHVQACLNSLPQQPVHQHIEKFW